MLPVHRLSAGLLFLAAFVVSPSWSDDFGNTYQTAYALTLGVAVNGNNETAGDVDYFKFNAIANHLYTARITNLVGLSDTVLRLWSTNGTTLLVEKDEIDTGETIVWRAPANGIYFLSVQQFFEDQTGTYRLTVANGGVVVDDYGNTPLTAAALPTTGGVVAGNIEYAGDVDVFSLSTTAGRFYRVETLLLDTGVDTVLRLLANDGATQLVEDDQGGREANASRVIFGSTFSGSYFAEVRLFFPDDVGGYAISATDEGVPVPLTVDGTPVQGTLTTRDAIEIFQFDAFYGNRFVFDSTSGNLTNDFRITILGPDGLGKVFSYDFSKGSTTTWICSAGATFYLVLEEPYLGGSYTLSVRDIGPPPPPVDINGDGVVDALDLLLLAGFWRQSPK